MTFYLSFAAAILIIVSFGTCIWAAIRQSGSERDDHEALNIRAVEGVYPERRA